MAAALAAGLDKLPLAVQNRLTALEVELANRWRATESGNDLLVVDGPLRGRTTMSRLPAATGSELAETGPWHGDHAGPGELAGHDGAVLAGAEVVGVHRGDHETNPTVQGDRHVVGRLDG